MQYQSIKNISFCKEIVVEVTDSIEQGARLNYLIETLGHTQVSMAEAIGISQSYISQMVTGSRNISRKVFHAITKKFQNVNVRWLMTGEGSMFLTSEVSIVSEPELKYGVALKDPGSMLREVLADHERRIAELEKQVRWLRGQDEQG